MVISGGILKMWWAALQTTNSSWLDDIIMCVACDQ